MIRLVNKNFEIDLVCKPVKYHPHRAIPPGWAVYGTVKDRDGLWYSERWLFFEKENATRFYNQYK